MIKCSSEFQILLYLINGFLWGNLGDIECCKWGKVENIANKQGVFWILYARGKSFTEHIPNEILRAWRANMIETVTRNNCINEVQENVIAFLKKSGIRAAVLKGLSCSMYYPMPEMRALGDIDLLIDEANLTIIDEYLEKNGFVRTENEHAFHVGYSGKGVTIEIHYAITNFPDSMGGKEAEEITKNFLDEVKTVHLNGMTFPVLSDSHQALMLLTHMERHMLEEGFGLRQLCDWAVFVNGSQKEHWQEKTIEILKKCGLMTFAKVVTKTCINYLGLNPEKAPWCMDVDDELTQMMIQDIFRSGNMGAAEEDNTSSLFFDRAQLGKKGQNRLMGLIVQLNKLAYRHYPFLKKCKILLPFFWVFFPLRYLVRSILGLRPKKSAKKVLMDSAKRQKLYKALDLYGTKK